MCSEVFVPVSFCLKQQPLTDGTYPHQEWLDHIIFPVGPSANSEIDTDISLTSRSPRGNTVSSHGVKLLGAGGADTEEGAFHVLTQGSSTHALQGLTLIHICEPRTTAETVSGGKLRFQRPKSLSFQIKWAFLMAQTPSSTYLLVTNPEFPLGALQIYPKTSQF